MQVLTLDQLLTYLRKLVPQGACAGPLMSCGVVLQAGWVQVRLLV